MSKIEFVSHEVFPEDQYITELVYIQLEGKYRVAYIHKKSANGGQYWSGVTVGVTKGGKKVYVPAFVQDSNFLERDIRDFLEQRKWELGSKARPTQTEKSVFAEDLPF